jgi:hypothetical protein
VFLRINATTNEERTMLLPRLEDAISGAGAWITDYRMFSNISVCLMFEAPLCCLGKLWANLSTCDLRLTRQSIAAFQDLLSKSDANAKTTSEVKGTIEVTFVHGDGSLKIKVPAVPG